MAINDIDLAVVRVFPNIKNALRVGAPTLNAFQGVAFLAALVINAGLVLEFLWSGFDF